MKIIFLDFDGVMTSVPFNNQLVRQQLPEGDEYGVLFATECIDNLRRIIEETGADIVVTSDWKQFMSYKDILEMWERRNLPGFVTDVTPTCSHHRGDEIDNWLKLSKLCCPYVIIDDLEISNFNTHQRPHVFQVNSFYGLDYSTTQKIINHLNNSSMSEFLFIRRKYPERVVKSIDSNHLLRFYRNEAADSAGRKHEDILRFTDRQLEYIHDYIQWIFPTVTPSSFNQTAPIINEEFQRMFASDGLAQCNYCKSCRLFLKFLGFTCNEDPDTETPMIENDIDAKEKFYNKPWHNFLRITRVLESMNKLGHCNCSKRLYSLLVAELAKNPQAPVGLDTLNYWAATQDQSDNAK